MKMVKALLLFFIISLILPLGQTFADTIILKGNGDVLLITDGVTKNLLPPPQPQGVSEKNVLGSSAGVTVTVSLSSFLPTDTPVPTTTPKLTATPTRASANVNSQPTAIPQPSTSLAHLLSTITTPSDTTTQQVDQVIKDIPNQNPLVISPTSDGTKMILRQGKTQAVTTLPIQLASKIATPQVLVQGISESVISPTSALQAIESVGTYIIPSTAQINLTTENNQAVYRITGSQYVQLFHTFIIKLPLTIDVAAKTGKPVQVKNPFLVTVLEFFHIGKRVIH